MDTKFAHRSERIVQEKDMKLIGPPRADWATLSPRGGIKPNSYSEKIEEPCSKLQGIFDRKEF